MYKYFPVWKDKLGDEIVINSAGLYDSLEEAKGNQELQEVIDLLDLLGFRFRGWGRAQTNGDGSVKLSIVRGEHPVFGPFGLIGGPYYEDTLIPTNAEDNGITVEEQRQQNTYAEIVEEAPLN